MRHQQGHLGMFQDMLGHAAEDRFAQPAVGKRAQHQKVGARRLSFIEQHRADAVRAGWGGLHLGLAHGVKLKNPIAAGLPLLWSDVDIDQSDDTVRFRRDMEAAFAPASGQSTSAFPAPSVSRPSPLAGRADRTVVAIAR